MRRRQLKWLWARLKQLSTMQLTREELLMKLGAARDQSRTAWRLVVIEVAADSATFSYRLDRNKLRQARSREGRYLLRTNLVEEDPAKLWSHYLLLVAVEEAFKNLKGDLAIRPIFHQLEARIEAHVFIAFLAYCLHVTLARRLHALAPGLTPRSVLEKFAADADDRRAPPDHRRPRAGAHPLYRARTRAQPVAEEAETGAARPTHSDSLDGMTEPRRNSCSPAPRRCARNTRRSSTPGSSCSSTTRRSPRTGTWSIPSRPSRSTGSSRCSGSRRSTMRSAACRRTGSGFICAGAAGTVRISTDIPMRDIVEVMLAINAGAYSFEAGNVRHEHEWKVWQDVKLPDDKLILPGVVSHATNVVEHPELVADRILRFADLVGRERVIASTDCGLGGRVHPQIAWAKLEALAQGAALASRQLWQ